MAAEAVVIEDVEEAQGDEEWMRLLEGDQEPAEEDADVAVEEDDAAEEVDVEAMEVSDEGDATALLAAVKERLTESGRSHLYNEFLMAISSATVDREAALAILRGHPDLVAAFRRCFAGDDTEEVGGATAPIPDSLTEHRGESARAAQLVHLVFANAMKSGHEYEQTKMLEYVKRVAAQSAFPRRLILLRGPPGVGKTQHALREIRQESSSGLGQGEQLAMRLTHVCSVDDFFTQFKGASSEMQYTFNARSLEANHTMNEARVRLAMEVGIDPLYVDNTNMHLWEMRAYVMLADAMGYVVSVVSPSEIATNWNNVEFLTENNKEKHKKTSDKYVGTAALEAMIDTFEPLSDSDPRPAIREAVRSSEEEGRCGVSTSEYTTQLAPSAILYKFEKLLKEGSNLLRYTPPDGKGWGVNGEFEGEWHSFREKADGSCCYDDKLHWWTDEPENCWTLDELAQLADLRKEAMELEQAALPTATSHPGLFAKGKKASAAPAKTVASKPAPGKTAQKAAPAPAAKQVTRAGMWQAEAQAATGAAVPASRSERFKFRMKVQKELEAKEMEHYEGADVGVTKKPKATRKAGATVAATSAVDLEDPGYEQLPPGVPSEQEEMSASAFLGAVKARLTEWGKPEQYQEFVLALSGTVDAKAAVRILRGHDDLLRVFKRKFAPQADLMAIKSELKEEDSDAPRPPSGPPPGMGGRVKEELGRSGPASAPYTPGSFGRVKTEAGVGPRPPPGHPGVKQELGRMVKSEVKSEDMPRPPKYNPNAPRPTVTIGDESDEELDNEASIAAAVKKGRDECIAQLAKQIFRRERATGEGARPRLAMVRYATKVASRPRFPRELFLLRGTPGTGKTEYAVQQLADYVEVDEDEQLAARLTHVCSADDFFEQFKGDDAVYKYEASKLESAHLRNEARARLAMEAGVHPLFVDAANLRLWEMRPYVLLAERLGYVVSVVEPADICEKWDDVDFLVSANDTSDRRNAGKVVAKPMLAAMVKAYESVGLEDPVKAIRGAFRSDGPRAVEALPVPPEGKKPAWMQVKEEMKGEKRPAPGGFQPPQKAQKQGYAPPHLQRAPPQKGGGKRR